MQLDFHSAKALALNKHTLCCCPYLRPYTSLSTKQGVINTSSEALFKDKHCFLSGRRPRPLPSYLSLRSSSHAFICGSLGARYLLSFK